MSVGLNAGEKGNIVPVTECLQSLCRPLAGHKHTWSTNLCHHNNTKSHFFTKVMFRSGRVSNCVRREREEASSKFTDILASLASVAWSINLIWAEGFLRACLIKHFCFILVLLFHT